MVQALHREVFPVDARFDNAVDRLQEVGAVRLNVEAEEIGAQQPVHQFALPRTNPERLRIRPGNMPEDGHARVGPALLDHSRQQGKVIILHQHDRAADVLHLFQQGVRELAVHFLIMLPVAGAEQRARVGDVAKRPEPLVGEPVVIAFLFFLGQPDSPQGVARIVRRNQQAGHARPPFPDRRRRIRARPRFHRRREARARSRSPGRWPER